MGDLDEGILKQVESLVNSTIETHLKSRDSMLVEMQKSMQPVVILQNTFSIERPAVHRYGLDFHSRALLCNFTTGQ